MISILSIIVSSLVHKMLCKQCIANVIIFRNHDENVKNYKNDNDGKQALSESE